MLILVHIHNLKDIHVHVCNCIHTRTGHSTCHQPSHTRLTNIDIASLLQQLSSNAAKWRGIGIYLGFRANELDTIQSKPALFTEAPVSWLEEMLAQWLQWAPGDSRGSTNFATLEDLKTALNKAGLGATAHGHSPLHE